MSCRQHPALDLAGSYKCLIFTLLSINFSRNIFAGEVDQVVLRVQGVMIWWWPESCRNFTTWVEQKHCLSIFCFFFLFLVCFFPLCCIFTATQLSWAKENISSMYFSLHIFLPHAPQACSRWISGSVFVCCKTARLLGFLIPLFSLWFILSSSVSDFFPQTLL